MLSQLWCFAWIKRSHCIIVSAVLWYENSLYKFNIVADQFFNVSWKEQLVWSLIILKELASFYRGYNFIEHNVCCLTKDKFITSRNLTRIQETWNMNYKMIKQYMSQHFSILNRTIAVRIFGSKTVIFYECNSLKYILETGFVNNLSTMWHRCMIFSHK